jgi:CheY-like chemotaxis protein
MATKPRILVVEDEPGIADTIRYALATDGFEPVCVGTGAEALGVLGGQGGEGGERRGRRGRSGPCRS